MSNVETTSEKTVKDRIEDKADQVKHATSGAVAYTKDALDHAADSVEARLHRATDKVADVAGRATDKAADFGGHGREFYHQATDKAEDWLEQMRDYIREKPVQSVAIAIGGGWLLGRLLRR